MLSDKRENFLGDLRHLAILGLVLSCIYHSNLGELYFMSSTELKEIVLLHYCQTFVCSGEFAKYIHLFSRWRHLVVS